MVWLLLHHRHYLPFISPRMRRCYVWHLENIDGLEAGGKLVVGGRAHLDLVVLVMWGGGYQICHFGKIGVADKMLVVEFPTIGGGEPLEGEECGLKGCYGPSYVNGLSINTPYHQDSMCTTHLVKFGA